MKNNTVYKINETFWKPMPWSETYSYGTSQGKVVLNAISLKMEPEFFLMPKYVLTDPQLLWN